MGFVFLLLLFCAGAMRRETYRLDVKTIGFYPLALFGAMFLGVAFSYTRSQSARFLVYHIAAALCVLVTVSAVHTAREASGGGRKRLRGGVVALCGHAEGAGTGGQQILCGFETERRYAQPGDVLF